jgi:hypothetical protein
MWKSLDASSSASLLLIFASCLSDDAIALRRRATSLSTSSASTW